MGVEVIFKSVVGDDLGQLVRAAQHAFLRSDIVVLSGGLGPTEDDLTREAVAKTPGLQLQRDAEILAALEARFAGRQMEKGAPNAQQGAGLSGGSVVVN